jgi:hypothetical protein
MNASMWWRFGGEEQPLARFAAGLVRGTMLSLSGDEPSYIPLGVVPAAVSAMVKERGVEGVVEVKAHTGETKKRNLTRKAELEMRKATLV